METCDSWKQAHSFSCRMVVDLKAPLAALEIPTGGDGVGQTSEQCAGDRTEGQPTGDDAEDSEESDEDEEEEAEEGDE